MSNRLLLNLIRINTFLAFASSPGGMMQIIMVVDDSDDVRLVMAMQLRASSYEVIKEGEGREVVELASEHRLALIFMDIHMPVMDGLATTRMVREIDGLSDTRIAAFSAFGSGDNRRLALDAGCDVYFNKTENINRLPGIAAHFLLAA